MENETADLTKWIESTLKGKLDGAIVEVYDMSGTGEHFQAQIIAPAFEGKSMVEQHRIVFDALGDAMKAKIHALSIKTMTPAEWEKFKKG